ncbi:Myelin-oligodendrocyte glycoprotein, partial [Anabarilius grahami]
GFTVEESESLVVSLGSSVVLPCQINKRLLKKRLKVEWRRTDSETLVHLYEDGESRQQQEYHDRAHFFTDQIQHGNFSLRLDNLTAEDEGKYTCKVYSEKDCVYSAITDLELYGESRAEAQQQEYHDRAHFFTDQIHHGNFSLRLDNLRAEDEGKYICKVYRNQRQVFSTETYLEQRLPETVFHLQMFLVFSPNILMFLAFVLWGVSEVLFKSVWDKSLNYTGFEGVVIIVLFVIVLLLNLIYIILFLPVFLTVTRYDWDLTCGKEMRYLYRILPVYVFGSVGVVLLNSVTLMTELILKTVNGDGAVGDLRVVVFSFEILFTLFLMILLVFEPCEYKLNFSQ